MHADSGLPREGGAVSSNLDQVKNQRELFVQSVSFMKGLNGNGALAVLISPHQSGEPNPTEPDVCIEEEQERSGSQICAILARPSLSGPACRFIG